MTIERTTYKALNTRAANHVATLDSDDPLIRANTLIDQAVALQDQGRVDEADALLDAVDEILA